MTDLLEFTVSFAWITTVQGIIEWAGFGVGLRLMSFALHTAYVIFHISYLSILHFLWVSFSSFTFVH